MWKNTIFFQVWFISPISCWHVTRLSRHPVRLMNERQSLYHSQSKVVCRRCFRLWLLKHWKFVSLIDSDVQTSQEGEETQNKQRKTESYVFNGFGNGISHSRELDEFLQAEFGCTWKISSVGKDEFKTWEFVYWKLGPLFVFAVIQCIFSTSRFLFEDKIITKPASPVNKGLVYFYDK